MKGICPNCERETELEIVRGTETIKVRGDVIPVELEYFRCQECNTEFRDPKASEDPLEKAYEAYRRIHGMVSPETLKGFRSQYSLTQQELSDLLGWGGATLSRYENGALQDEAHDTVLKMIMDPKHLLDVVTARPGALGETKRQQLTKLLQTLVREAEQSIPRMLEDVLGVYEPDEYSGYVRLNVTKLLNAMIYFCLGDEVPKTKLNKLLFYADFKHFKDYTVSITGAQYAHLPYGPAPDRYQFYIGALQDEEHAIRIEEKIFSTYAGEYLSALKEANLSIFSTTELKILASVKEHFASFTASAISNLSHKERGFQETRDGELISYKYAEALGI